MWQAGWLWVWGRRAGTGDTDLRIVLNRDLWMAYVSRKLKMEQRLTFSQDELVRNSGKKGLLLSARQESIRDAIRRQRLQTVVGWMYSWLYLGTGGERDPTRRSKSSQESRCSLRWGYWTTFCRERKEPGNGEKRVDEMGGWARGEDETLLHFIRTRGCRGGGRREGWKATLFSLLCSREARMRCWMARKRQAGAREGLRGWSRGGVKRQQKSS